MLNDFIKISIENWYYYLPLLGGLLLIIAIGLTQKPKHCPKCNTLLPKVRKPKNIRQALWGGGTCPNCGCEVNRKGIEIK